MKIIFNIKCLTAILWLLNATFAYSSFKLPALSTDDEKLAFLLQVRKEIPKLFVDAAKYDIDLFTLLDNEAELVNLLKKYPRFDELYSDKKYLNISVKPTGDIWVGEVKINPEAIEAWKQSILEKIQIAKNDFPTPEALLAGINTKEILSIDPLELLNKIGRIEGKGKAQKEQIKKFKAQNDILGECKKDPQEKGKKTLHSQLIKKFQCIKENYDKIYDEINKLPNLPSIEEIDSIIVGITHEEKIFTQLYLAAVLKKNPNNPVPQNWEQFKNSIEQLKDEDLIYLNDKDDVLKPNLATYFDIQDEQRFLRSLDIIHKEINKYASDTISKQSKVTSTIELVQVPPKIGIFRGCIGGDCSSQFSFPYPNDPHERVFYIKGKTLKGYVSTTEVMVGAEKALYVITISGAHVSAQDVELIFRGFEKAKETLGVKHIILPTLDNIDDLINFPTIKAAYENHIKKSNRSVELVYQDKEIRDVIEQYKPDSGYNKGEYDYSDKNKNGIVLLIENNPVDFTITERLMPQNNSYSNEDLFEFIKELRASGRKAMIDKVLNTQITKTAFGEEGLNVINNLFLLLNSCKKPDVLNIQQFKEKISDILISLGLSKYYLNSNPYLMSPGYLKCEDAFSQDNLEEAAMLIAKDIKNNEKESSLFSLFENHTVKLNTTKAFNKLNKHYYEKLSNPDAEIREVAIKVFSKTKPTDPEIHKALAKALVDKIFSKIKPTDPEIHKALAKALGDDDSSVRKAAANALGYIKPTDPEVYKALAKALVDYNSSVRKAAAEIFVSIKPTDPEVHKALVQALVDNHNRFAMDEVAFVLAKIKPTDPEVHKALVQALVDNHNSLAMQEAAFVLAKIKPTGPEVHKALVQALVDNHNSLAMQKAAFVLAKIKPTDPEVHKALAQALLHNHNSLVRKLAASVLGQIKPTDPEIHRAFIKALVDENSSVRQEAANALRNITLTDKIFTMTSEAIPEFYKNIFKASSDRDFSIVKIVHEILRLIKPTNKEGLDEIANLLQDEDMRISFKAHQFLKKINSAE